MISLFKRKKIKIPIKSETANLVPESEVIKPIIPEHSDIYTKVVSVKKTGIGERVFDSELEYMLAIENASYVAKKITMNRINAAQETEIEDLKNEISTLDRYITETEGGKDEGHK